MSGTNESVSDEPHQTAHVQDAGVAESEEDTEMEDTLSAKSSLRPPVERWLAGDMSPF
jgi:hypothetical protein